MEKKPSFVTFLRNIYMDYFAKNLTPNDKSCRIWIKHMDRMEDFGAERFDEICRDLEALHTNFTKESYFEMMEGIFDQVMSEGITFENVLAYFVFMKHLTRLYEKHNFKVEELLSGFVTFMDTKLSGWMRDHGNYTALLEDKEIFKRKLNNNTFSKIFHSLKTIVYLASPPIIVLLSIRYIVNYLYR